MVEWRGRLPHRFIEGRCHFFTLRVAGAIPRKEIPRIRAIAKSLETTEANSAQFHHLQRKYFSILEATIDQPTGFAPFTDTICLQLIQQELSSLSHSQLALQRWVIMPNHLHWITYPLSREEIESVREMLNSWKGRTAKLLNQQLQRKGSFWQREWFDHVVRSDYRVKRIIRYIEENPVQAGLVKKMETYPGLGPI